MGYNGFKINIDVSRLCEARNPSFKDSFLDLWLRKLSKCLVGNFRDINRL